MINLQYLRDVPFELIPKGFIDALKSKSFSYEEYLEKCHFYNNSSFYWNIVGYDKKGWPMVVVWGTWDPLEKHMRVLRCSSHPKYWALMSKEFLLNLLTKVRQLASAYQAEKLYWESDQWKAWLRQLDGHVKLSDTKVIEVY